MATVKRAARSLLRLGIVLATAVAVFYSGFLVLAAVVFARQESQWKVQYVFDYGPSDFYDSDRELLDIYAQPPMTAVGWLGMAALIGAAFAVVVWGLWLILRLSNGTVWGDSQERRWSASTRVAARIFVWGIVALSAYSLMIFTGVWIEWRQALDAGLAFTGDPKPEPNPAYDPSQIPLGIAAFAAIAAVPLLAGILVRRARRRGGRA